MWKALFALVAATLLFAVDHVRAESAIPADQTSVAVPAANHFDVETATQAYLNTIAADARARSDAYFESGYWLVLWDFLIGLGVAWLLLAKPLSQRMRAVAERITRLKWLQPVVYGIAYVLITTLITLPWAAY